MASHTTMSLAELSGEIEAGAIDTVVLASTDVYGRLRGKRYDAIFLGESAEDGSHACDCLLTVDMEMEPVRDGAFNAFVTDWERTRYFERI
jgi:glutamine synthetase